jgi:ATP-dependent RNA helicase DeaD
VSITEQQTGFDELGLRPEILETLVGLGYEEPTPIQRETIPLILSGRDLVGQAATGTGKTAAFALPILQHIPKGAKGKPEPFALILVPTRELAVQVSEAMYKYGRVLGARVLPVYGGQPIGRQLSALSSGVHVVVATPGRAMDHIARGTLNLNKITMVVLDEADEMLDMGFAEDIEEILKSTPDSRQTVMFSATIPPRINGIAKRHLTDPLKIQIGLGDVKPGKALVRQTAYVVQRSHKPAALGRILDVEAPGAAIVFCRTRTEVETLTETMNGRGYRAEALHGGLGQESRDRVMGRVRSGATELLIATDVAARGLDIDSLTHVVNYDVPSAPEAYVHRIGRVGRAGREGVAITLAEPREQRLLENIERLTKQKISIEKVPTVADLRARQMELTVETLRAALTADDLENYAGVLDMLPEFEQRDVALAAIRLAHLASGAVIDEKEIPDASARIARTSGYETKGRYDQGGNDRWANDGPRKRPPNKGGGDFDRGPSRGGERSDGPPRGAKASRGTDSGERFTGAVAKLYIGLGHKDGVRAGDLVGSIANESELSGKQIGPIRISEHFSVVGVPEGSAEAVIATMRKTTLKGKKVTVRRFVEEARF